jgi:hypothetical protein
VSEALSRRALRVRFVTLMVAATSTLLLGAASAQALTVANPPLHAGRGFTVKVSGAAAGVSVYLSPQRKLARGDAALGHLSVSGGALKVKLGTHIKPGGYFVLVCSGSGQHACASSKKATAVLPSRPSRAPAGVNGAATAAAGASAVLGAAGGSLHATGPDGTKYVLAVPPDSVANGTTVTLSPLSALSGAGLGKLVAGAEITPAGVTFLQGAVLIVQPAHAPSVGVRRAVAFNTGGTDIHSIPMAAQGKPLVLPLGSSGGYALLSGGSLKNAHEGTVAALRDGHVAAASPELAGFYEALLASFAVQLAAAGGEIHGNSAATQSYNAAVVATLDEWHAEILSSEVPAAMNNDEAAETAIRDLATWARDGSLLLGDGQTSVAGEHTSAVTFNGMAATYGAKWPTVKLLAVLQKLSGAAYDRAQQKCAANHDLAEVPRVLSWYDDDVLAGHADSLSPAELLVCEHFKVEFASTMEDTLTGVDSNGEGKFTNEYTANVEAAPQTSGATVPIAGSATGSYAIATGVVSKTADCEGELIDQGGNPTVFSVVGYVPASAAGASPQITIETGVPTENYLNQALVCHSSSEVPIAYWWLDWDAEHRGAGVAGTASQYTFALSPGAGPNAGTLSFANAAFKRGTASVVENTTIKVTHTPAPYAKL